MNTYAIYSLIAPYPSKTENKSCFQNLFFKMEVVEKQVQTKVKYGDTVIDVDPWCLKQNY